MLTYYRILPVGEMIKIRGQPTVSPNVCKFVVDRPIIKMGDAAYFRRGMEGKSRLPKSLFKLDYIKKVGIEGDTLVLTAFEDCDDRGVDWPRRGKEIGKVIRDFIALDVPPIVLEAIEEQNDEVFEEVAALIKTHVNPSIASHGGIVTLMRVVGDKAYVKMGGGCQGCAASSVTLKRGVESMIKAKVDEINEIVDITNHDAGVNPYYKKGANTTQVGTSPMVKSCGCSSGGSCNC
jgi:Fe-S cluster biogenesis protein NfuA